MTTYLDSDDPAAGGEASNVDHQHLVLGQLGNLGAFLVT